MMSDELNACDLETTDSSGRAAYERMRELYATLPRDSLHRLNMDADVAVSRAQMAVHLLAPHRERLGPFFPDDPDPLDTLLQHARATWYLDRVCSRVRVPDGHREMAAEARETYERLRAAVRVLIAWRKLDAKIWRTLPRAKSDPGIAAALIGLVRVLRTRLPDVEALTPLRAAALDRAAVLGDLFIESLARSRYACDADGKFAQLERRRAFTMLDRHYERVRLAAQLALGDGRDAVIPRLRPGTARRAG